VAVTISIAKAREQLAELVNRAAYGGERPVLTRRGRPVAAIVPIADLERLERSSENRPDHAALTRSRQDQLNDICERNQVRELSVFGSALRNDFAPNSDVDLLVEFQPHATVGFIELGRLEKELVDYFGRQVDLVPKNGLRPILREEVLATARVLFAA
jgi:prevent-host-death family protein